MRREDILKDVYNDFFGDSYKSTDIENDSKDGAFTFQNSDINSDVSREHESFKEDKVNAMDDSTYSLETIDSLFISDESKELLKKIINYMELYSKKEESNYIPFNIRINGEDDGTIKKIIDIIKFYSSKYGYVSNEKLLDYSLYNLSKEEDISELYNNGIVHISNLEAISLKDVSFKKKFIYLFCEALKGKSITIITGKRETVDEFILNDPRLDTEFFIFNIDVIKPTVNDVYNELISRVNISDEFNIKLLDYISSTFDKSDLDYSSYVTSLYNYISFNKDVPETDGAKSNDEVFKELNELVGLRKVKDSLNDLVDLITLKNKTKDDLKINNINLHMVFLGNPGTGKTTVARMIADILYNLGYIKQNKLLEVTSRDLVAEYVGQTAVKTMDVVNKAMGGILFIDEAYTLATKNNDNSYNGECIATLIKAMEDYRDNLVVIFAGYTKEMQDFLDSNSGIVSRIGYTFEFEDYTNEELIQIFKNMVVKSGFVLEDDAVEAVNKLVDENRDTKNFGNARFIRNVYEKTIINHARNTKNNKKKSILKTITKNDISY